MPAAEPHEVSSPRGGEAGGPSWSAAPAGPPAWTDAPTGSFDPGQASSGVAVMDYPPRRRHAPAITRADLVGAFSMASLVSLTGVPLGWLWSRLAPPQLSVVQQDGSLAALPIESQHRFDDLATFVMLGAAVGLLVGVAAWLVRHRRGPLTLLGITAGALVAAWLAMRTGISFADTRYAAPTAPSTPGDVLPAAPRLDSTWPVIVQPLVAALAYGIAAAANGLEDLGRRLT
jgi:hypothetical protein